ncbi:hypothetical protein [uncultured Psychroserpens sp.]|uniref:hypothetical protein n=1 Tax=uncultured Psychroserpens sp. TaxID=255436 RepID=UPI002635ADCD|nr:hypothetical protein [uncultured Psychroserpens sp.]
MNSNDTYHFDALKKAVISKFLENHSASSNVKDWNGDDIALFQEDLFSEVNAKVSEKWFYSYFKHDAQKLPRIDMLNLLSGYIGFEHWNAFKSAPISEEPIKKKSFLWLIIFIPIAIVFLVTMNSKNTFTFCFLDNMTSKILKDVPIDIKVLQDNESPLYFKTDSLGCFTYKTNDDKIRFVVSSPYHKTDTIVRSINTHKNSFVRLDSDDYALILKYYTDGNIKDWTTHKQKLSKLFHNDAQIYRLYDNNAGVEILNKEDFVRLLTIPTQTLKKIRVLDQSYQDNQIITLKFTVQ